MVERHAWKHNNKAVNYSHQLRRRCSVSELNAWVRGATHCVSAISSTSQPQSFISVQLTIQSNCQMLTDQQGSSDIIQSLNRSEATESAANEQIMQAILHNWRLDFLSLKTQFRPLRSCSLTSEIWMRQALSWVSPIPQRLWQPEKLQILLKCLKIITELSLWSASAQLKGLSTL